MLRFEKETKMLQEKGFFITKDGLKSTDVKVKFKPSKSTLMPKKPLSTWILFSVAQHTHYKGENDKKKVMTMISEKWQKITAKEMKKLEAEHLKDVKRYEAQLAELDDNGYFVMEDGTKSSEYEVVPKKKRSAPMTQAEEISAPKKRQKK